MRACIGLWGYEGLAMDRKKLTRELDLYIKQNYRPEGFKFKEFIGAGTVGATIDAPHGWCQMGIVLLAGQIGDDLLRKADTAH